jgi:MFS family permease
VFLAGLGVMAAEMTAPRLLAPSFGTTRLIWTNIIGTVLASLTLGAWLGGKLADRRPTLRAYATTLALAGLLLAAVPLAPPHGVDLPIELREQVLPTVHATWYAPASPPGARVFTDDRSAIELYEERRLLRALLARRTEP